MHFRHVPSCPPRRLSPRFPRRFLADYPFPRLPAVHADFITFVPRSFRLLGTSIAPPKRCRPRQTGSRQPISHPIRIAFGCRIILRNHIASLRPCRLVVMILRRLDRLVAWLRDGREGQAWHVRSERIGTAPDGARRIYQMPYRMSVPAGHRGSGYPILILRHGKRTGCCMRVEQRLVAIPGSLAYRISSQNHLPCNFDPFAAGRIILSGWVWPSRAY